MEQPKWTFDSIPPGTTERDSVSEEFFSNGTRLSAIIRESIQNSLDAWDGSSDESGNHLPVRVRIYFSGEEGALPAERYKPYRESADVRYFSEGNGLARPVPSGDRDCTFITIEDFRTTGLTGDSLQTPSAPEDVEHRKEWNYYNYFFRENGTSKGQKDTRGSWGAGKCVFQRASRLKTSFALSIRDGWEPREFLVGKATLKIHGDESHRRWAPDGWFGVIAEEKPDDPTFNPKQPVVDSVAIAAFKRDFNLVRVDEPGTSIVIPHVRLAADEDDQLSEFNRKNLVQAVLSNFLVAILQGDLEVEIQAGPSGDPVRVDKASASSLLVELASPEDRAAVVTRGHGELVSEILAPEFPTEGTFNLAPPGEKPDWKPEMFELSKLRAMKKRLLARKTILVRVPMPVLKRESDDTAPPLPGSFRVAIRRSDLTRTMPPVFFRLGLLVDAVKSPQSNYYISAVVVDEGPVADMLVSAEPPSHNEWRRDADRLTAAYKFHGKHLAFVQNAVREILDAIDSSDKDLSWEPLADIFGIPKEESEPEDPEDKPKPDPAEGKGEDGGGGEKPPPPKPAFFTFAEIEGERKGFKISNGPGLASAATFPLILPIEVGYDTFRGIDWNRFDFDFSDNSKIKIEVEGSAATILERKNNEIKIKVNAPDPFSVSVTGFDQNRDLAVKPKTYIYPDAFKEND